MSFTRGTTARGLPYPGSNEPVYNVPTFLQQLADAVAAQLASAGADQLLVSWSGTVNLNSNAYAFVPVPQLAVVRGAIAMANSAGGGSGPWLYWLSPTSWTDQTQWGKAVIGVAALTGTGGYPDKPPNLNGVGLNFIAWGDPK